MRQGISRTIALLAVTAVMVFAGPATAGAIQPNAGTLNNSASFYADCDSDQTLRIWSWASGHVSHWLDGNLIDSWYNGSSGAQRVSTVGGGSGLVEIHGGSGGLFEWEVSCLNSDGSSDPGGGGGPGPGGPGTGDPDGVVQAQ